jgi:diguanylate cyclase (GGDEF)-like protein
MQKILIADDNEEMLDTLSRIFGLYNFEVITALNGKEAIELTEVEKPDIIILDGMMPVMDGFEACQILKKQESTKEIPVIFLTANFMELRDRIKGLELGADDYLLKPFNSKELVARLKSIIKRAETTRKIKEENRQLINKNSLFEAELKELLEKTETANQLPVFDATTGLYKFELFKDQVEKEIQRSVRFKNNVSLIVINYENLNKLEELLGKQLFNYIIIKIANFILNKIRNIDLVSFDDLNSFYLLLPQTDSKGAESTALKIKNAVNVEGYIDEEILNTLKFSKKKLSDLSKLKFSIGIASVNQSDSITKVDDLFSTAERGLSNFRD